ncbi:MAG: RES family NAD+ phosphorylase [Gemmatimonadales bacterium]
MAEAWRIVKAQHAAGAFSGEGARLYGGRWTSRGRRAVYASSSAALAILEMLVHLEAPALLPAYVLIPVGIPDDVIQRLDPAALPPDWREYPAPARLQEMGDAWLDAGVTPALQVPSAIVPAEFNFLLNPAHPEFARILIGAPRPYTFDPRLLR